MFLVFLRHNKQESEALTNHFQSNARNGSWRHFKVYATLVDRMVVILYIVYGQLGFSCSSYLK